MVRQVRVAHDDRGFTMIELLTAMIIMGVIMGMVGMGATGWTRAREHSGSAEQLVSFLRQAQQRALTEAVQYCVTFDTATTFAMHKGVCTAPVTRPGETDSPAVTVTAAFVQADGTTTNHIVFTPRGSASPGTATVKREGRDPIVLKVEGLTARVAII
jgi:prepilin-type N-terminal cleavage/methylation domain-containing protein